MQNIRFCLFVIFQEKGLYRMTLLADIGNISIFGADPPASGELTVFGCDMLKDSKDSFQLRFRGAPSTHSKSEGRFSLIFLMFYY